MTTVQPLRATPINRPRVSLMTFAAYLSARTSGRIECVQRQRELYESPYVPAGDFYADFVRAAQQGRRTGADALALQRAVSDQRDPVRQRHYQELTGAWLRWLDRQPPSIAVQVGRATWASPDLDVTINPHLALEYEDGTVRVITLWLKAPELPSDAASAALRLLTRHMPELHPGGDSGVLDLRRGKLHQPTRRPTRRGYDVWLEGEARSFAHLWHASGKRSA